MPNCVVAVRDRDAPMRLRDPTVEIAGHRALT
jgi:hypothetical protein